MIWILMGTSIGTLMQFIRNHYERTFQDCAAQKLLKHLWESAPQEALTTCPVKFFVHSELRLHDRAIAMPVFAWNPDGPLVDPPLWMPGIAKKALIWSDPDLFYSNLSNLGSWTRWTKSWCSWVRIVAESIERLIRRRSRRSCSIEWFFKSPHHSLRYPAWAEVSAVWAGVSGPNLCFNNGMPLQGGHHGRTYIFY